MYLCDVRCLPCAGVYGHDAAVTVERRSVRLQHQPVKGFGNHSGPPACIGRRIKTRVIGIMDRCMLLQDEYVLSLTTVMLNASPREAESYAPVNDLRTALEELRRAGEARRAEIRAKQDEKTQASVSAA